MNANVTGTDPLAGATIIDKDEARQGVAPHELRYMLLCSTVAVIVGFVVVYWLIA
jgi:hypothetical protein